MMNVQFVSDFAISYFWSIIPPVEFLFLYWLLTITQLTLFYLTGTFYRVPGPHLYFLFWTKIINPPTEGAPPPRHPYATNRILYYGVGGPYSVHKGDI